MRECYFLTLCEDTTISSNNKIIMAILYSLSKKKPHFGKEKAEGKFYAVAQHNGVVKEREFARRVSRMARGYDEYTVWGVMQAMAECLRKQLLEGYRVEAGPLGDFYTVINGTGSENEKNFARSCIKDVRVNWAPGKEFRNLKKDAKFKRVITRKMQTEGKRDAAKRGNPYMGVTEEG